MTMSSHKQCILYALFVICCHVIVFTSFTHSTQFYTTFQFSTLQFGSPGVSAVSIANRHLNGEGAGTERYITDRRVDRLNGYRDNLLNPFESVSRFNGRYSS